MTDNTPRITDAREPRDLTLRELLRQGYLLTQERDKHSLVAELDELIQEYQRVLQARLRNLGIKGLLTEKERVAHELKCLPSNQPREFALAAITEYISTHHPKIAELDSRSLRTIIKYKRKLEKKRIQQRRRLDYLQLWPGDVESTPLYTNTQAKIVRIGLYIDLCMEVITHSIAQIPLAQIIATITNPRNKRSVWRVYTHTLDVIECEKLDRICPWEEQVATREITERFPSLFELEADIHFWREWAVLRQVEENVP